MILAYLGAQVEDEGLVCDLLWSDPEDVKGWEESHRGVSYVFGPDVLEAFLRHHDLELMVQGNRVIEAGYEYFAEGKRLGA